jgi:hypothetical protein
MEPVVVRAGIFIARACCHVRQRGNWPGAADLDNGGDVVDLWVLLLAGGFIAPARKKIPAAGFPRVIRDFFRGGIATVSDQNVAVVKNRANYLSGMPGSGLPLVVRI